MSCLTCNIDICYITGFLITSVKELVFVHCLKSTMKVDVEAALPCEENMFFYILWLSWKKRFVFVGTNHPRFTQTTYQEECWVTRVCPETLHMFNVCQAVVGLHCHSGGGGGGGESFENKTLHQKYEKWW